MRADSEAVLSVSDGTPLVLGQRLFQGSVRELLEEIVRLRGEDRAELIVTANVDHVIDLAAGTDLRAAYRDAAVRVVDGMPVLWLLRRLGAKNLNRIAGADLIDLVPAAAAERNWRVALTGGSDVVLKRAVDHLRERYPAANIHAISMPRLSAADDDAGRVVVDRLRQLRPDVTFVCLGAPKQESWVLHWKPQLPPGIYIGAGAAVDFAAGVRRRAPLVAQRLGVEWVWRLFQEFSRLAPRYLLKGPKFIGISLTSMRRR